MAKRPPKKRKHPRKRIKSVSAPRSWGGAFGKKKRGAGDHEIGRGLRRNAFGDQFFIYDNALILPPPPLSVGAAYPIFREWLEQESKRAQEYLAERTGIPDIDPLIMCGAICVEAGRLFQPWIKAQRYASDWETAAFDWLKTIQSYKGLLQEEEQDDLAELEEDDETGRAAIEGRAAPMTGIIGWFIRARTETIKKPVKHKPSKRKTTPQDILDTFGGSYDAPAKAPDTKAKAKRTVRGVGRGGKARKGGSRNKHGMARGGRVRRKRKR